MTRAVQLVKIACLLFICAGCIISCHKNDNPPEEPPGNNGDPANADTILNHLVLLRATKKQGAAPKGPSSSSLKISFKDTLRLHDKIMIPIKFLHEDTTRDVAGMYVQIHGSAGSSFYYDVPEVQEIAENDTVSVFMMGINPVGLIPGGVPPAGAPFHFEITMIPHDANGQPLGEATKPVTVSKPSANPNGCGLVRPPGDYWDWELSFISDPSGVKDFLFLNSPDVIWGKGGQNIKGCCVNGHSSYNIICASDTAHHRSLHFNTFFTYTEEVFKFIEDGTFVRLTGQFTANPDPQASNFCGNGNGVVTEKLSNVTYNGNWTVRTLSPTVEGDSLYLTLQGTGSTGGGYGNPGGRIHILDCYLLMLIQPDNEVPDRDLVKVYNYRNVNSPYWNPFN